METSEFLAQMLPLGVFVLSAWLAYWVCT